MQMPWDAKKCVVQTVRAAFDYYSAKGDRKQHPWHDSVAVQSPDIDVTWYAQLRLLFQWGDMSLALIRWYEDITAESEDILTGFDCVRVKWEAIGSRNSPRYQVIELDNILRRVYVVKDYNPTGEQESFHVSSFKWDRMVPDKRGIDEKEEDVCSDGSESDRSEESNSSTEDDDDV